MRLLGIITAIFISIVLAASAFAEVPGLINYQGRLTDDAGAPVADGTYDITFSMYKDMVTMTPLWSSLVQPVTVSGGLFTYVLGSDVPFPSDLLDPEYLYLGIKVGSDPEINPRQRLISVPYALESLNSDTADVARKLSPSAADDYLQSAGDTLWGDLVFGREGANSKGSLYLGEDFATLNLSDQGWIVVQLSSYGYGELIMRDAERDYSVLLSASSGPGGFLRLADSTGNFDIGLFGGKEGNDAVRFPDDAIDADEILDEPGIASNTTSASTSVQITTAGTMMDVAEVTIATPSPGYLHIIARYSVSFANTTGENKGYLQISSTEGGGLLASRYTQCGMDAFPTIGTYYYPGYTDLIVYNSTADTYTFRLEAMRTASSTGIMSVHNAKIMAMYIPTSYGSVKSVVADPSGFTEAEAINTVDQDGNAQTAYKVDLRELELRVKEAQLREKQASLERLDAEQELERAKREIERNLE